MEILRVLNQLKHPNIVELLGSYTYDNQDCFLFPLFQMDLHAFLALPQRYGEFEKDVTFYAALQGISSALETLHEFTLRTGGKELKMVGYHHDLVPENILVDSRTFYLTDFGLARLDPADEAPQRKWIWGLRDYVGPECIPAGMLNTQGVGRPLDIWAFGCLLLDIAVYMQDGPAGVESFQDQRFGTHPHTRGSDQYFFLNNALRPAVTRWLDHSKAKSNDPTFRLFLDVALLMLTIDPDRRPKAVQVSRMLSFVDAMGLFNAIHLAFKHHLELVGAAEGAAGKPDAIRLEHARFTVWGKAQKLTEGGDVSAASGGVRALVRQTLASFLGEFDLELMMPLTAGKPSTHRPFHERIKQHMDKLRKATTRGGKRPWRRASQGAHQGATSRRREGGPSNVSIRGWPARCWRPPTRLPRGTTGSRPTPSRFFGSGTANGSRNWSGRASASATTRSYGRQRKGL